MQIHNNLIQQMMSRNHEINKSRKKQSLTQSLYTNITIPVASSQKNIRPTHTQYWNAHITH